MKVPIPRTISAVGYGANSQMVGFADGGGTATLTSGHHPLPIAGTVRKLFVRSTNQPQEFKVMVMKNGLATGLGVTMSASAITTANFGSVSFGAGDDIGCRITENDVQPAFGYDVAITCEWEGAQQIFGICPSGGSVIVGEGYFGGALGNGIFEQYAGGGFSRTYSIVGVNGALTRLILKRYASQSGGSWVGYIRLNGVTQDGTGGTVDTSCVVSDAGPSAVTASFLLPVVIGQHVDVAVVRFGNGASFAVEQVGAGVAFMPDTPDEFMLVGGSNDDIDINADGWKWNESRQLGASIDVHTAPSGGTKFYLTSFYVERPDPSSGGYLQTLLVNGNAAALAVQISAGQTSGSDTGLVTVNPGSLLTIAITNQPTPSASGRLHWSFGATTVRESGTVQGFIGPLAWVHWPRRIP